MGLLFLSALLLAGCGYVGEPAPPLANVPSKVADLTAVQRGPRIVAAFTVPTVTTENFPVKAPLRIDLRIGPGAELFQVNEWAASAMSVPESPVTNGVARYEIAAAPWVGKSAVLGVRVTGANGKASDWSNFVNVPVVAAPATPADVRAEAVPEGVRLSWRAAGAAFRVFRRSGDQDFAALGDVAQSPLVDSSAEFGISYSYRVVTIVKLGNNREAESEPSADVSLTPEDRFPPAVPAGFRVTVTPVSAELSWEGNNEPDLAGYRVYRAAPGGPFEKIADESLPAYADRAIQHGITYRYAISAVDRSGNESARTTPVEATIE